MESTLFQALVQVESNSLQKTVSRINSAAPQQQRDDGLEPGCSAEKSGSHGRSTPVEETETSGVSGSKSAENAEEPQPSLMYPAMNKYRFLACCSQNLVAGLTDSASGALIPYIERDYKIGYGMVALIFIGSAIGFITAAPFVDLIRLRLGRARALSMAAICVGLGYIPLVLKAPFPVLPLGYFIIGLGYAMTLAIGNVFAANLQNATVLLGGLHGAYGIGGTAGPLIATSLVRTFGPKAWNHYYLLTVSIMLVNASLYLWSFWNYEKETSIAETTDTTSTGGTTSIVRTEFATMGRALKSRGVLLSALFIFAYQGAEVAISGWVISFLIATRHTTPAAVGNVTSGFWGGITIGRFLLSPIGARIGEKRFIYFLTVGAVAFELLVWMIPNVVGEVVSLAFVGLLLGPVYPCAAIVFTRMLSRVEQVSGLSVISAFGSSGGAVAPFTTGLLAQVVGTFVLHPIAIALFGAMLVCWFVLPTARNKENTLEEATDT